MEPFGFIMEMIDTSLVKIPLAQLFLLLTISTFFLLFGSIKLTLLTNYLFTFYWGFSVTFEKTDVFNVNTLPWLSFTYLGFGLMVVMLVLLSFRHTTQ